VLLLLPVVMLMLPLVIMMILKVGQDENHGGFISFEGSSQLRRQDTVPRRRLHPQHSTGS
jgi:hypothetical protein